jgi:hypothetical protein
VHTVALDGCVSFPEDAANELRAWFVRGKPMPLPETDFPDELSLSDLRAIDGWIAAGAPLEE